MSSMETTTLMSPMTGRNPPPETSLEGLARVRCQALLFF
jgi:hypothetical protein